VTRGVGGVTRLVICDGNRVLSEALAAALGAYDGEIRAVASSTADGCIAAVIECRPDVCMLDPLLPTAEDGLRLIGEIRDRWPGLAVLVISDVSDPDIWVQARKLGIAGLVGKNRSVSQIADALRAMAAGERVFDPAPPLGAPRPPAPFVLTPREEEVLRRIAAGQHTHQMATEMDIAISTLRTYVKNVFAKLGVHSRLEAAAIANQVGGEMLAQQLPADDQRTVLHSA
jgi:two-component system, NarL family, nitrate/nitrite response regulator NarL